MSRRASAFCITHTSASEHLAHLAPFAVWTAFPSADYYGASVALGVSPFRRSRVPHVADVQVALGALFVSLRSLETTPLPQACPDAMRSYVWCSNHGCLPAVAVL
jgi:hypothetical protein